MEANYRLRATKWRDTVRVNDQPFTDANFLNDLQIFSVRDSYVETSKRHDTISNAVQQRH